LGAANFCNGLCDIMNFFNGIRVKDSSVRGRGSREHTATAPSTPSPIQPFPAPLPTRKRCAPPPLRFRIRRPSAGAVMDPSDSNSATGTPIDPLILLPSPFDRTGLLAGTARSRDRAPLDALGLSMFASLTLRVELAGGR
jgi:hypothetical protein